jgi:hypothetical protein
MTSTYVPREKEEERMKRERERKKNTSLEDQVAFPLNMEKN